MAENLLIKKFIIFKNDKKSVYALSLNSDKEFRTENFSK